MKRSLLPLLLCGVSAHFAMAKPPNILLILADDVGCETIGAYGGERWKTPHLDRLAKGGLRADYCFSMPVCHPTRVCMMTGKYPFRLKAKWGTFPKQEETHALGNVLRRAGYRTAIAGKWQLCLMKKDPRHPARMGFDEAYLFGWHEGARYHDPLIYHNGRAETNPEQYGPELYVDFLCRFMEQSHRRKQPFFAFYSMALAHDVTDDLPTQVPYQPGKKRWMNYGEMIVSMDAMVGKLVAKLDQLGLRENTVIFFTGDNGTAVRSKLSYLPNGKYRVERVFSVRNGKPVFGGKGTLGDAGTKVPLIANWPAKIKPGSRTATLVDSSDWLPTLAEIGGVKVERHIDGVSFVGLLTDQARRRKFAFAEQRGGRAWVRTQGHKLYNDGRFYDLQADPQERSPLGGNAFKTTRAARDHRLLRLAFSRLKYPQRGR